MMPAPQYSELYDALARTPSSRCATILAGITDLFLSGAEAYSSDQVAVFDDVIGWVIEKAENAALIDLSAKLARVGNAPPGVVARLAQDNDIAVAGPLLEKSEVIAEDALVEIASTRGPRHLAAIASRPQLAASVADILVDRGNTDVALKVVGNERAAISELGFAKLINRARSDKMLAVGLAGRKDIPAELKPFLDLTLS